MQLQISVVACQYCTLCQEQTSCAEFPVLHSLSAHIWVHRGSLIETMCPNHTNGHHNPYCDGAISWNDPPPYLQQHSGNKYMEACDNCYGPEECSIRGPQLLSKFIEDHNEYEQSGKNDCAEEYDPRHLIVPLFKAQVERYRSCGSCKIVGFFSAIAVLSRCGRNSRSCIVIV